MLSQREKLLTILVAAVIGLLTLDRYVISPLWAGALSLADQRQQLLSQLDQARRLIETQPRLEARWRAMVDAGLTDNPAEAESQFLSALRDWSEQAGLALASIKPERAKVEKDLGELRFVAVGQGKMRAVARFLWLVESAEMPVRINKLQVASRQEGDQTLSMTLHLSTLYRLPDTVSSRTQGGAS